MSEMGERVMVYRHPKRVAVALGEGKQACMEGAILSLVAKGNPNKLGMDRCDRYRIKFHDGIGVFTSDCIRTQEEYAALAEKETVAK
jgi:hypothetical protein